MPETDLELQSLNLARSALGRDLTADEGEAFVAIVKAAIQAINHGFVRRLAERVAEERADESVEEFFGDVIHPD